MPESDSIISLSGDSAIIRRFSTTRDLLRFPVVRALPVAAFLRRGAAHVPGAVRLARPDLFRFTFGPENMFDFGGDQVFAGFVADEFNVSIALAEINIQRAVEFARRRLGNAGQDFQVGFFLVDRDDHDDRQSPLGIDFGGTQCKTYAA